MFFMAQKKLILLILISLIETFCWFQCPCFSVLKSLFFIFAD